MELRTLIATTKERQSALQMELNTYVNAVTIAKDAYEQMVKCATNSFNQPIAVLEASLADTESNMQSIIVMLHIIKHWSQYLNQRIFVKVL